MTSTDLAAVLEDWLNSASAMLRLEIDRGAVAVMRHPGGIACCAAIPLAAAPNDMLLERALCLAEAARRQFHDDAAMLSLSPQDQQLWLWMRREPDDIMQLCRTLETLLNQRDAWMNLLLPPPRTALSASLNLNTQVFLQGEQHA
ncbi:MULTISPECIES: type III secretion system chaperone [unclassified Brenneria]|uniref:type III secretion system chaperone n=1 Tax=unclassified Brenneria TaxID=2634434 RepID=UPI0015519703|nr:MULTISPECIES: type III secretion system chaperone [unclassified Brenneria]MBJ7220885.1 CesT family type III secretion system chaperone [Brenneria sp. L3-3C-1]MEE3642125.1 type III secretion system chaperone [Brenneria sp. L3_3C_1]MEE3650501.1 type III secretion system chaperone [Brenneria sp. HEZEL_4_2_4]NPD00457.1 type III secretion protein [Brenneria sp. hezel4-2-4]